MTWIFRACIYINLKEGVKASGQLLLAAIGAVLVEDYPELSEGR